ncbi:hypothetical protein VN97_g3292 [Penicillium thymicola]|uniref:Uncharacterized protein n=1 Tax=Penicillium thymicola TaxID=293382 RepID=A0AAI9TMQ0_PENTH|nr:hypothetical protein VN97_g3292 [Penicillium thymicola]
MENTSLRILLGILDRPFVTRQPPSSLFRHQPPPKFFLSFNLFSLKILYPSQLTTRIEAPILDIIILNATLISVVISSKIVGTIDYQPPSFPSLSALTR